MKPYHSFGIAYLIYLFIGILVLLNIQKGDEVLFFNHLHQKNLDQLFVYLTFLGDGIFCVLISILFLLFRKYYASILIFATYAISGMVVQFQKNFLFDNIPRPKAFFEHTQIVLHFVENVKVYSSQSFPSGHSASVFALFAALVFTLPKSNFYNFLGILCCFLAILASISRIWLVQHFFIDTFVGSLWGVGTVIFVVWILRNQTKLKA